MKTFTLSFITLIFSFSTYAQAKIEFKSTSIVFDDVPAGSNGERSFVFKNSGSETLVIERIVSTSNHLKVMESVQNVEPGNSGEIKILYDTDVVGPIRRTITVYSNAQNSPVVPLKVKGCIVENKKTKN